MSRPRVLRTGAQSYDVVAASVNASPIPLSIDKRRTIQSAKADADINVIVKRFGITGQMPASVRLPSYGDFSGVSDFQTAMNVVRSAEESFLELPASVRKRFGNNPQAFLEFCSDEANIDEMRKMGLANPKVEDIIKTPVEPVKEPSNARSSTKRAAKAPAPSESSDGDSGAE